MTALVLVLLAQGDPRLQAKVDLRLEIAPVDEAVAALGRAAHLSLTTSETVRELKTTILVDGMPAGKVMARLADVLRVAWQPEAGGYRLVKDPAAASREASFLEAERGVALKELRANFQGMMTAASVPFNDLPEAQKEAQQALDALKANDEGRRAALDRRDALQQYGNRDGWTKGRVLQGLGEDGRKRLLSGEPTVASTAAGPGGVALPANVLNLPGYPGEENAPANRSQRVDLFMRVDLETGQLIVREDRALEGGGASMTRSAGGSLPEWFGDDLAGTPFAKEITTWDANPLVGAVAERRCDPKTPQRPSEWWSGFHSESDALEWLHDASGVPIVAMASRRVHPITDLRFDGTVADYVKRWRDKGYGTFRTADGVLMARPAGFWHRRLTEIPEAWLRSLEAKSSPSIDDYAALAAKLTDRQAALAASTLTTVLRVCPYPLDDGVAALRLWAALSRSQQATLRGEGSISYNDLDGPSRVAFETAARDVFSGGWHEGAMVARFAGGAEGTGAWSVFGRTKDVSATGRSRPRPPDERNQEWSQEPREAGITLALGTGYGDSVRYTLPLTGLPKGR